MAELTNEDLSYIVSRIPGDVRKLMREHGAILAGGFIRSLVAREKVGDIDLFGPDKNTLEKWAKDLALERKGKFHETDNAFTVLAPPRYPVQFIHRWTYAASPTGGKESVEDLLEKVIADFDFSVAQAAIAWVPKPDDEAETQLVATGQQEGGYYVSVTSERFYPDLAGRRLVYLFPNRNEDAGGSLMRVRKFLERGYRISAANFAGTIARLVTRVDFDRIDDYRPGEPGMPDNQENYLAMVLTGLLREVDPLHVIDGVELVGEPESANGQDWREALKTEFVLMEGGA